LWAQGDYMSLRRQNPWVSPEGGVISIHESNQLLHSKHGQKGCNVAFGQWGSHRFLFIFFFISHFCLLDIAIYASRWSSGSGHLSFPLIRVNHLRWWIGCVSSMSGVEQLYERYVLLCTLFTGFMNTTSLKNA
jgi:hypothetical protein